MFLCSCNFYKTYYYFIIFWILDLINTIQKDFYLNINEENNSSYIKENNLLFLIFLICLNLGDLISGFLVIYTKIKMKYINNDNQKKEIAKQPYTLIYNDLSQKENKYLLIFIVSLLDFMARAADFIFILFISRNRLTLHQTNWLISFDILSRVFFCYIMLNTKLYKHHIVSLLLCGIGFIIMSVFGILSIILNDTTNNIYGWIYLLFMILKRILFAIEDSINKILLINKFLLPHFLMFWRSLFSFVYFVILTLILYFTSYIEYNDYASTNIVKNIKIYIILIITEFFKIFSIFRVIYLFTPTHVGFLNVVSSLFEIIKYIIITKIELNILQLIFDIISLIVIIFGTLIFNEIIVINYFCLNENTKKGFLLKEKLDNMPIDSTIITNYDEEDIENSKDCNDTKRSFNSEKSQDESDYE